MGRNFVLSTLRIVQRNQLVNFRFHNIPMDLLIPQHPKEHPDEIIYSTLSNSVWNFKVLINGAIECPNMQKDLYAKSVKDWHNELSLLRVSLGSEA